MLSKRLLLSILFAGSFLLTTPSAGDDSGTTLTPVVPGQSYLPTVPLYKSTTPNKSGGGGGKKSQIQKSSKTAKKNSQSSAKVPVSSNYKGKTSYTPVYRTPNKLTHPTSSQVSFPEK